MKKNALLLILIIAFSTTILAQKAVAPHKKIEQFYKTTTCVVFDSDVFNTYNNAIKKAIEQSWTITPYKFISMNEFRKLRSNKNYSFLIRTKVTPDNDKRKDEYTFLSLVLGERDKIFSELTEICSFPLSYYNVDYDRYDYKMGALLQFMQNHIKITFDNPKLTEKNIIGFYNKNTSKINNKEILINKENLASNIQTTTQIKANYNGKIKLTTPKEIQKAINEKQDAIILHIVFPHEDNPKAGRCYKMLIGAADGKLYYFDSHRITNKKEGKFLESDLKKLK